VTSLLHVNNRLDTCLIHSVLFRSLLYASQQFDITFRITTSAARGSLWRNQAKPVISTQRLRVHSSAFGSYGHDVEGFLAHFHTSYAFPAQPARGLKPDSFSA